MQILTIIISSFWVAGLFALSYSTDPDYPFGYAGIKTGSLGQPNTPSWESTWNLFAENETAAQDCLASAANAAIRALTLQSPKSAVSNVTGSSDNSACSQVQPQVQLYTVVKSENIFENWQRAAVYSEANFATMGGWLAQAVVTNNALAICMQGYFGGLPDGNCITGPDTSFDVTCNGWWGGAAVYVGDASHCV